MPASKRTTGPRSTTRTRRAPSAQPARDTLRRSGEHFRPAEQTLGDLVTVAIGAQYDMEDGRTFAEGALAELANQLDIVVDAYNGTLDPPAEQETMWWGEIAKIVQRARAAAELSARMRDAETASAPAVEVRQ